MIRSRWLHHLLSSTCSRKDRRRQAVQQRRGVRPMLETLEDRLTPSTVIENAPDAATLQTDLNNATAANTQYIINLTGPSSAYNLAAGQQLTVSAAAPVSIVGSGQSITGNGNRVFLIDKSANVTLRNVTISGGAVTATSNGYYAQGGGIFDSGGNVTLSKVAIQANTASGGISAAGGGIFVMDGTLTIEGGSVIQSNRAVGGAGFPPHYPYIGGQAAGGGVYVSASTVTIRDSTLRNNVAQGGNGPNGTGTTETGSGKAIAGHDGGFGGGAQGGGLYVASSPSSGWTVALIGDTFSGNAVLGGNGGNGAAGPNASGSNAQGDRGGIGGDGGYAAGGAAYFNLTSPVHDPLQNGTIPPYPSGQLTILNDLAAPATHPSLFVNNSVQAGNGGKGGAGGTSTGTANNADGERGGQAGTADGGAVSLVVGGVANFTASIGNTTFFANTVSGGNGGVGGAAGTGGSGTPGTSGDNQAGGAAYGGGGDISLTGGTLTMVNSTVANNTVTAGLNADGARGHAVGGGLLDSGDYPSNSDTFDNNTITQNTLKGAANSGSGIAVGYGNPTFLNNLIQGNQSIGSSAFDLDTAGTTLKSASNNFITSISPNAVSTAHNIVGNPQVQLGGVVGVAAGGQPSGGPIYYPLLSGTVSVGYGTTSVLNTIANVEGTTTANATDEIGNLFSTNGSINLGAVQVTVSPPPPSPPPALSLIQEILAITLDSEALLFANDPPVLMFLNSLSERLLGQPLPPTNELLPDIEAAFAEVIHLILAGMF